MTSTTIARSLVQVSDSLADQADDLVTRQLTVISSFPSYDRIPPEDLSRSAQRNVARVVACLRGQSQLPDGVVEDERASGRLRALQGVPSDDVVAAYRAVLGVLRDAFLAEAARQTVPLDAVLEGTRLLWKLTDQFSLELVAARHHLDLDLARREERERLAFLNNVVSGLLGPSELFEAAASHGLRADKALWVLRGRPRDGVSTLTSLMHELEASQSGALIGIVGGDVVGIVAQRPPCQLVDAVVAIEGPVPLSDVSTAFVEATRLLNAAIAFDLTGFVDFSSISLGLAIVGQPRLGQVFHARHIAGVESQSPIADLILETVSAFLRHRRSIPLTARALTVHVNTVRYRLEKFEQLTGADLSDTQTTIEVWWALTYRTIRESLTVAPQPDRHPER